MKTSSRFLMGRLFVVPRINFLKTCNPILRFQSMRADPVLQFKMFEIYVLGFDNFAYRGLARGIGFKKKFHGNMPVRTDADLSLEFEQLHDPQKWHEWTGLPVSPHR